MTPEADDKSMIIGWPKNIGHRLAEEHRPNNGLDKSSPYIILGFEILYKGVIWPWITKG